MGLRKLLNKAKELSKKKGHFYLFTVGITALLYFIPDFLTYHYYKSFKSQKTFRFQGRTYNYFYHKYNNTWKNERAVEIPIAWDMVKKHSGEKILEIGNVLSHYFVINHDVLDKYEKADGVINQDVEYFQPEKKYNFIVSISTLEHVGWDEKPREPMKIIKTIKNLKNILSSDGQMLVTLPLGQNPEMDRLLMESKISFTKQFFLKRNSENTWEEQKNVDWNDLHKIKYNRIFQPVKWLVVGIIHKK